MPSTVDQSLHRQGEPLEPHRRQAHGKDRQADQCDDLPVVCDEINRALDYFADCRYALFNNTHVVTPCERYGLWFQAPDD